MSAAKAQVSLGNCTVSSEPLLLTHKKKGHRWRRWQKFIPLAPLDSCTCMFNSFLASDDFCHLLITLAKQFGPRSGPTECRSWSGSKPFDTLIADEFFKKVILKKSDDNNSMEIFSSMQRVKLKNDYALSMLVSTKFSRELAHIFPMYLKFT